MSALAAGLVAVAAKRLVRTNGSQCRGAGSVDPNLAVCRDPSPPLEAAGDDGSRASVARAAQKMSCRSARHLHMQRINAFRYVQVA